MLLAFIFLSLVLCCPTLLADYSQVRNESNNVVNQGGGSGVNFNRYNAGSPFSQHARLAGHGGGHDGYGDSTGEAVGYNEQGAGRHGVGGGRGRGGGRFRSSRDSCSGFDPVYMVCLTNLIRTQNNLPPFKHDPSLDHVSIHQCQYMSSIDTMTHSRPGNGQPGNSMDQAGIQWHSCGENVGYGGGDAMATVEEAVMAWYKSCGHYKNIINGSYLFMGSGCQVSGNGNDFWAQDFADVGGPSNSDTPLDCSGYDFSQISFPVGGDGCSLCEMGQSPDPDECGGSG